MNFEVEHAKKSAVEDRETYTNSGVSLPVVKVGGVSVLTIISTFLLLVLP